MVRLNLIQASNASISSITFPLVAVFVGATSGIGEATLKQFARYAVKPRVYFVGRSQEAADRIIVECKIVNKNGEYNFIKADTSLIKEVDAVCQEIQEKEDEINLLFLSVGALKFGMKTEEGLHYPIALAYHGRTRFTLNLLPQLENAKGLRRVVSVFTGTKEGPIDFRDIQGFKTTPMKGRGHASSMVTLSMEAIASKAPTVSFIHDFPGFVKTNIARDVTGPIKVLLKGVQIILGPFRYIPIQESGERHLFLSTSAMYPPAICTEEEKDGLVVPLIEGLIVARGSNGKEASGVYSIDEKCESGGVHVETLLNRLRIEWAIEKVMKHTSETFKQITGA